MTRKWLLWLPFALCVALFGAFFIGLKTPSDHVIASQLVGKALPGFEAPAAFPDMPGARTADFADGKPRLLNVFASWCVPCEQEIPILMQLKAQGVEIVGIAIHDAAPQLQEFLARNGNPYSRIGLDDAGRAQIEFGSAGVPETFVIDGSGKIVYQHIGVIKPEDVGSILALLGKRP